MKCIVKFIYGRESNIIEDFKNINSGVSLPFLYLGRIKRFNFFAMDFVNRNKISHPKKCYYHKFYLFYLSAEFIKCSIEKNTSI